jgi:hypothetical protein
MPAAKRQFVVMKLERRQDPLGPLAALPRPAHIVARAAHVLSHGGLGRRLRNDPSAVLIFATKPMIQSAVFITSR